MCKLTLTTTPEALINANKQTQTQTHTTAVTRTTAPIKASYQPVSSRLTRSEVLEASHVDTNLLIIIDNYVFNATKWQFVHPGGHLTLRALCGKDATDAFYSMHPRVSNLADFVKLRPVAMVTNAKEEKEEEEEEEELMLSRAKEANADRMVKSFRALTRQMYKDGLFDTDYSYFLVVVARIAAMFMFVLYLVLHVCPMLQEDEFQQKFVSAFAGVLLGLVWQQAAFIGHDLGHNGITHNRLLDSSFGLFVGNFFTGFSIVWWKRSHNVHHIVTNSIEHDPDIQHLPIFAITPYFLCNKVYSTFFGHELPLDNLAHVLVKYQHWLFYPVMAFARFNLYIQSLLHAMRLGAYSKEKREYIWCESLQVVTLLGYHVWMTLLTAQLPNLTCKALFFILAHNVAGILHIQITLSHFCMPTYNGVTYDDNENGFVKTQLRTSLDIDCPAWFDWFHGGLQFQTVHHIWPRVPRHNLRNVQKILSKFCKEHDLEYKHMGFVEANKFVLARLKHTAKTTKSFHEIFHESFHLQG